MNRRFAFAAGLALALVSAAHAEPPGVFKPTLTKVTLAANTDTVIGGTNTNRKYLLLMNTGAGEVDLDFGKAATVGAGLPLDPGAAANKQGGVVTFESASGIPGSVVHGISSAGTTVVVIEGF